ncbi:hypothetical protein DIPPA_30338 [Diplonema papillatum]|nr:hypothetical protein DIPPA_11860 [Diplonema papillatum]KAJ9468524.1 hypothetical protein DIPPA_30338 [Diplonema papillatum]
MQPQGDEAQFELRIARAVTVPLKRGRNVIGRGKLTRVTDRRVSRRQLVVHVSQASVEVEVLGSSYFQPAASARKAAEKLRKVHKGDRIPAGIGDQLYLSLDSPPMTLVNSHGDASDSVHNMRERLSILEGGIPPQTYPTTTPRPADKNREPAPSPPSPVIFKAEEKETPPPEPQKADFLNMLELFEKDVARYKATPTRMGAGPAAGAAVFTPPSARGPPQFPTSGGSDAQSRGAPPFKVSAAKPRVRPLRAAFECSTDENKRKQTGAPLILPDFEMESQLVTYEMS